MTNDRQLLHPKAFPPFAALRAFEAVGRLGGIRKAAASLSLNHAVVSRHVRLLEAWLGTPLYRRAGGRLHLTDAGAAYHRRVSAALVELAMGTLEIQQLGDGPLRIWCVPGFAVQWLTHQVADFEAKHPDSPVEVRPTDHMADLHMLEADVDIRFYGDEWLPRPQARGLRWLDLARPPIMAVASPDLAARLGPLPDVAALARAPLLHEEHDEQWRAWFRANGLTLEEPIAGTLLWHAHLAIAAARAGRGVALASRYLVAQDLANGSLVELDFPGMQRPVIGSYMFIAREDRWDMPGVAKLRRYLQSRAGAKHAP